MEFYTAIIQIWSFVFVVIIILFTLSIIKEAKMNNDTLEVEVVEDEVDIEIQSEDNVPIIYTIDEDGNIEDGNE